MNQCQCLQNTTALSNGSKTKDWNGEEGWTQASELSGAFRACTCDMHMCADVNADMLTLCTCLSVKKVQHSPPT